ncbi:MAG: hypothetical protein V5A24_09320 [Haloarculaceae archaeon]
MVADRHVLGEVGSRDGDADRVARLEEVGPGLERHLEFVLDPRLEGVVTCEVVPVARPDPPLGDQVEQTRTSGEWLVRFQRYGSDDDDLVERADEVRSRLLKRPADSPRPDRAVPEH